MGQQSVNGRTDLPGIGATAPPPQEERGTADRRDELNADLRPFGQRLSRGRAERHDPFFSPFAEHPHDLAIEINVVEIAAHQLADPYAGRIEQFQAGSVPRGDRVTVIRGHARHIHEGSGILGTQDRRQRRMAPGSDQTERRVDAHSPGASGPGEIRAYRSRAASDGGATAGSGQAGQPGPQVGKGDVPRRVHDALTARVSGVCVRTFAVEKARQRAHVGEIGPAGVFRKPTFGREVGAELGQPPGRRACFGRTGHPLTLTHSSDRRPTLHVGVSRGSATTGAGPRIDPFGARRIDRSAVRRRPAWRLEVVTPAAPYDDHPLARFQSEPTRTARPASSIRTSAAMSAPGAKPVAKASASIDVAARIGSAAQTTWSPSLNRS